MSLKWKTQVPVLGQIEAERDYLQRLSAWLRDQEQDDFNVESFLSFGGSGVSDQIFGFEGQLVTVTAPEEEDILVGPAAPKKFIVIGLHIGTDESTNSAEICVRKNAVDYRIAILDPTAAKEKDIVGGSGGSGYITLDSPDESIVLKTLAGVVGDYGWAGSYVLVE